jgi:AcrR family transcriptional regulator
MGAMNTKTENGYAVGRARRDQIVAEATQQFGRVGFNKATTMELAAACGISRAGLLHHFPTKEALLKAVLEARDVDHHDLIEASVDPSLGGLDVFRRMIEVTDRNAEEPGIVALFASLAAEATAADHPAHSYFIERYARVLEGTESALQSARNAGYLRAEVDIRGAALDLTALRDGLQVMWLLSPHTIDMGQQLRSAIQRLLTVPL